MFLFCSRSCLWCSKFFSYILLQQWLQHETKICNQLLKPFKYIWKDMANCFLKFICLLLQLVQLTVTAPSGLRCPMPCRCADKGSVMICHRSSLMHIPPLLETAMLLDLDHNHISLLQNASFLQSAAHRDPQSTRQRNSSHGIRSFLGSAGTPNPASRTEPSVDPSGGYLHVQSEASGSRFARQLFFQSPRLCDAQPAQPADI